jgi:hypothetical protein
MAKALVSKGKTVLPEPTQRPSCETCKYKMFHMEKMFCSVPLPPHVTTNGRVPYVHNGYSCGMFVKE